jgi:arylsulfatase A-like enzyme
VAHCQAAAPRPNIIFILADDLGYTDVACFGSKFYETPNIDRMAAGGIRFTSGYKTSLDRDAIFWHFPGYLGAGPGSWRTTPAGAIHSGDWKLHEFFEDGRLELYNLRDDIGEKNNLAEKMPNKANELHAWLAAWRRGINAPMPTKNTERVQPAKAKKGKKKQPKSSGSDE